MATRIPFLKINGPSGRNIVPGLGDALLGVTITDNEGYESDECIIRMADRPPFNTPPAKGTKYSVTVGWVGEPGVKTGIYAFETFRKSGDPEEGHSFELVCRAADFLDKMKRVESAHYDEENGFGTVGKIFEKLATDAGVSVAIDSALADLKVPYRMRWNQSGLDFGSELADEIGAIFKPQAGQLVVRKRGASASASGLALPSVTIRRLDNYPYDFDIDPRPSFKDVATPWFDAKSGKIKEALEATRAEFSRLALQHPLASEEEAKRAAKAAGQATNRATGSGSIEMPGNVNVVAGAEAILKGYGPGIDDFKWEIVSATHEIVPEEGWNISVEVQTMEVA